MKITKKILQDIIKEELEKVLLSENPSIPQMYEKTIKNLIKHVGVEGALASLAHMVGANKDSLNSLTRDKN